MSGLAFLRSRYCSSAVVEIWTFMILTLRHDAMSTSPDCPVFDSGGKNTATAKPVHQSSSPRITRRITSVHLLALSAAIHIALLLYADHVDSHPERYGGLKYTDVDWRVVSDGAKLICAGGRKGGLARAQGWLVRLLDLPIGDPYQRSTFRYTPLLPLLISPTLIHPLLGKSILALVSLCIPPLLLASPAETAAPFRPTHLIWTLNPFVLNITTRGSPEAFICLLVIALVYCLRQRQRQRQSPAFAEPGSLGRVGETKIESRWTDAAAMTFAAVVGWKIYPVIYVPAIWAFLAQRNDGRWFAREIWRFGIVSAGSFAVLNAALWSIWGQPFLDHTYLYHLTRLDHRHNFSPYFYPIYLSLFPQSAPTTTTTTTMSIISTILRHPLTSFIPQISLVLVSGFVLTPITNVEFAMFVQTTIFVAFNKVCTSQVGLSFPFSYPTADPHSFLRVLPMRSVTMDVSWLAQRSLRKLTRAVALSHSQYFTWFLPLLPAIIPHLDLSRRKSLALIAAWIAGQALWLSTAYQLELMARSVYLYVWAAGLVLFGISVWVIGELVDSWVNVVPDHPGHAPTRIKVE